MKILIINNETKHIDYLLTLCVEHNIDIVELGEEFDQEAYDLYVLSGGGHHSVFYKPSPYVYEEDFIRTTSKPIIGICLGAQIIAQAYGSHFDHLSEKLQTHMDIVYNHKTYTVYEAHRYTIKELSKDLISLAQSSHGHEIIRHKEKPQRGFQFHPEANMDTTDGKELLSLVTGMDF